MSVSPRSSAGPDRRGPAMRVRAEDELFERNQPSASERGSDEAARPFREYLRSTPAAPLSPAIKALLWSAAVAVALLFAGALWKVGQKKSVQPPIPSTSTPPPQVPAPRASVTKLARSSAPNEAERTDLLPW